MYVCMYVCMYTYLTKISNAPLESINSKVYSEKTLYIYTFIGILLICEQILIILEQVLIILHT